MNSYSEINTYYLWVSVMIPDSPTTSEGWFELSPTYEYRGLRRSNGPIELPEVSAGYSTGSLRRLHINWQKSRMPLSMGIRDMKDSRGMLHPDTGFPG